MAHFVDVIPHERTLLYFTVNTKVTDGMGISSHNIDRLYRNIPGFSIGKVNPWR